MTHRVRPRGISDPDDIVARLGKREHAGLVREVAAITRDDMLDWILARWAGCFYLGMVAPEWTCPDDELACPWCVAKRLREE
jgi:hypothetical protein